MFQGGIVLFYVIDIFGACDSTIYIIACVESIAIGWIYGKVVITAQCNDCCTAPQNKSKFTNFK